MHPSQSPATWTDPTAWAQLQRLSLSLSRHHMQHMTAPSLGHHQQPLPHLLQQDQRCLFGRFLVYRQHQTLCASGPRKSILSNAGCHTGQSTCCRASTAGCGTGATWQEALERKGVGFCSQQLPAIGIPSGYSGGELTTAAPACNSTCVHCIFAPHRVPGMPQLTSAAPRIKLANGSPG